MSWSINLSGHSSGPHNDAVKALFVDTVKRAEAEGLFFGTPYGSMSSGDDSGSVTLSAADALEGQKTDSEDAS